MSVLKYPPYKNTSYISLVPTQRPHFNLNTSVNLQIQSHSEIYNILYMAEYYLKNYLTTYRHEFSGHGEVGEHNSDHKTDPSIFRKCIVHPDLGVFALGISSVLSVSLTSLFMAGPLQLFCK